jgi:hypothetical protein
MTLDRASDTAKAYRAARRYYGESSGRGAYRPAHVALDVARRRLETIETVAAEYRAAQGPTADSEATPVPADSLDAIKARGRLTEARHKAGIYHGPDAWSRHYPDTDAAFRNVVDADDVSGAGVDHNGWYTDPYGDTFTDGTGLCIGVVAQLPGRNGRARYVAGYRFGGVDGGPTFDLETIYESESSGWYGEPADALIDAAQAADELARIAGEKEREYQTAWQAGSQWAGELETVQEARKAALALLSERRDYKAKGTDSPAICRAIRDTVAGYLSDIADARARMARLADGDESELYFYTGDSDLAGAFCEGAGLDAMPGAGA